MSVIALSDILFGDLLTETGMKPWWETVRGYIFASSVAVALSTTYLTLNGVPVHCVPVYNANFSVTCNINSVEAAWTNTYCSNRIPWFIQYFGGMSLLAAILLLVVSSHWLHIPNVIDSFASFAEMVKVISDCNMAFDDIRNMAFRPMTKDDKEDRQFKLRGVCEEIVQTCRRDVNLLDLYKRRNYLLLGASVVIVITFAVIASFIYALGDQFRCSIATDNLHMLQGKQSRHKEFICVTSMAHHLLVLNVLFISSVLMQILPITYGASQRPDIETCQPNVDFMIFFWKCGQPKRSAMFSALLEYLWSMEAFTDIERILKEAIRIEDDYIIRSFYNVTESIPFEPLDGKDEVNPYHIIMDKMFQLYQSALNINTGEGNKDAEIIDRIIVTTIYKHMTSETSEDKYRMFLQKAVGIKNWKLTAGVINQCVHKLVTTDNTDDKTVKGFDMLQKVNIDYDILDDNGCSFMHYFFALRDMHTISTLLSKQYQEKRGTGLYAHYGGKSVLVSAAKDINIELYNNLAEIDFGNSQEEIVKYYDKFRQLGDSPIDDQRLIDGLSRIKFREWDDDAEEFAKKACDKRAWETFVTLLNCYIIPDENEDGIFLSPCKVTKGIETAALLPALSYPNRFVATAAKHIITCFTRDQRDEASDIIEQSQLPDDDRKKLKQFISDCNSDSQQQSNFSHSAEPLDTGSKQSCSATGAKKSTPRNIKDANSDSVSITVESASDADPLLPTHHVPAKED